MRMRRPFHYLMVSGLALSVGLGCALTGRGPRIEDEPESSNGPELAFRYTTGRGMQDYPFPITKVTAALIEAMGDLKIEVVRRSHSGAVLQIEGRTADRRSVVVTLRIRKPVTHLSCRVDWFGDQPFSKALLRRVSIRLGMVPPEPVPDVVPSAPSGNPYFSRNAIPDEEIMRPMIEAPYRDRPDF